MSETKPALHIAIVGAGLMGRLLALLLNRQGYQITLLDKDKKSARQSAAYAAAGLLTPLGEAQHADKATVAMGFESLKLWPKILETLEEYTFFQQEGTLVVNHGQDEGDAKRFKRFLDNFYPEEKAQMLNRQQLSALEPELSRSFHQALYLPDEGQIGNRKLLIALQHQLEKEGVTWLAECEVQKIRDFNDRQTNYLIGNLTDNPSAEPFCQIEYQDIDFPNSIQKLNVDLVIDCRGIGAKVSPTNTIKDNHALSDLRAVRGELFQLFAPDVHITRPIRLMHPRYQLYIAPKGKGFYVVGATEIESDDTSPMTVRSAMELLSAAYSVHSGFAEANIRQHISQLRPAFSDNEAKIILGDGVVQVNGLYRHGFLIAPVVLEQVSELIKALSLNADRKNIKKLNSDFTYSHWLPITYLDKTN